MSHINLIGLPKEKIDNYLTGEHAAVLEIVDLYDKGIMNMNLFNVAQRSLMNSSGYSAKNMKKLGGKVLVSFEENLFHHNNLIGYGKNELEAICDACKKLSNNPNAYNMTSGKYFDNLKLINSKK